MEKKIGEDTDLNKLYFTSDLHLGHDNVIKYNDRPFSDANEMNDRIIERWNDLIDNDDMVFILGDFSLCGPKKCNELLNSLKGDLYLVKGNHEKDVLRKSYNRDRFEAVEDYIELTFKKQRDLPKGQLICLFHYSCREWNSSHHGSWHLYGHSHTKLEDRPIGKSMDVGVDNAYRLLGEFRPFSFFEIKKIMDKRSKTDH